MSADDNDSIWNLILINEKCRVLIFQEYQTLMEENQRLMSRNETNQNCTHNQDGLLPTTVNSVEEAVLQTQIETLQWQLNQVNSRWKTGKTSNATTKIETKKGKEL